MSTHVKPLWIRSHAAGTGGGGGPLCEQRMRSGQCGGWWRGRCVPHFPSNSLLTRVRDPPLLSPALPAGCALCCPCLRVTKPLIRGSSVCAQQTFPEGGRRQRRTKESLVESASLVVLGIIPNLSILKMGLPYPNIVIVKVTLSEMSLVSRSGVFKRWPEGSLNDDLRAKTDLPPVFVWLMN